MTTLVWSRYDLRLTDNPALTAALAAGEPIIPVYIFAPGEEQGWSPGGAARWRLHHTLTRLNESLITLGSRLCIRASEDSLSALRALAQESGATRVVWNRRYEPAIVARDQKIKAALRTARLARIARARCLGVAAAAGLGFGVPGRMVARGRAPAGTPPGANRVFSPRSAGGNSPRWE